MMIVEMNPSQAKGHEPPDSVFKSEIAWRAYDKWVERGRASGTQVQDWLEAEAEGRQRREMACQLTVFEKRLIAEHAVCRILAMSDTLSDAAPKIIQAICESLDWDFGEIWVVDRNANVLRCVEVWHSPQVEVLAFVEDTRQHTFSLGIGLPGRIWASQSLAWIPDVTADDNLAITNSRLAGDLVEGFVTLMLVQIDPESWSLLYTNAGHCFGYVLDRQGQTKAILQSTGLPLGIVTTGEYPIGPVVCLESGDLIFLLTDGIVEATSADSELFGWQRTLDILQSHQQQSPEEILKALFDAVGNFSDHHLQDDLTAVVIEVEDVIG